MGRRQLVYATLAAGGIQLVGFVSNYLLALATGSKGSTTLLVVAGVVSVIGGTVTLLLQNAANRPVAPQPYSPATPRSSTRGGGRLSLIVALILMIILCGVGGTAVTSFATAVIDKLNAFPGGDPFATKSPDKNDPFKPMLARETSARSGNLTLKVTQVEANSKEIHVSLTAVNSGGESISLPLFKNCLLTVPGSATLEADPSQSQWAISVPGNSEISGLIVFHGKAQVGAGKMSFASVFRMGGGSITVEIPFATSS